MRELERSIRAVPRGQAAWISNAVSLIMKTFLFFLAVVVAIPLSGCDFLKTPEKRTVIAVGKHSLDPKACRDEIRRLAVEFDIDDKAVNQVIDQLIDHIVDRLLILEYAEERTIMVSEEEAVAAETEIRKDYSEEEFEQTLLKKYIDYEDWKVGLKRQLLVKKVMAAIAVDIPPVNSKEIKDYYQAHAEEFNRPSMIKFRQIVTETEKEAEMVLGRLKAGEDMEKLAETFSIFPAFHQEGQLAWIAKGDLEPALEDVLFALPTGKYSSIVKTSYGYHILQVIAARPGGVVSLPRATEEIESKLFYEKRQAYYKEWLKGLRNRYPVTINRELLKESES